MLVLDPALPVHVDHGRSANGSHHLCKEKGHNIWAKENIGTATFFQNVAGKEMEACFILEQKIKAEWLTAMSYH